MLKLTSGQCESVLIIEDNDAIREALETILGLEGYRVHAVRDGLEGLDVLRRIQTPCLILLDLMMPIMNGWDFLKMQAEDPAFASHPVVVVTALGVSSAFKNIQHPTPALGYLRKPIDLQQLLDIVGQYCNAEARRVQFKASHLQPASSPILSPVPELKALA